MTSKTKVTLLAGGVGGAKMAEGFAALDDVDLTIIVNPADDDEFHGLWVSPDIDTMLYTLSGRINRDQGWGVADDGCRALNVLKDLGADTWMFLGDADFGLHIYRTERLRRGHRPSDITREIAQSFGIKAKLLLPTDDTIQTQLLVGSDWISFQDYFVRQKCAPVVNDLRINGINKARPTIEARAAIDEADLIVIAPSNPILSIGPILKVPGIEDALLNASAPAFAVSPLIGGKAVKGPAVEIMSQLGVSPDISGISKCYHPFSDILFIDDADKNSAQGAWDWQLEALSTDILMPDLAAKKRLAGELLSTFQKRFEKGAA